MKTLGAGPGGSGGSGGSGGGGASLRRRTTSTNTTACKHQHGSAVQRRGRVLLCVAIVPWPLIEQLSEANDGG